MDTTLAMAAGFAYRNNPSVPSNGPRRSNPTGEIDQLGGMRSHEVDDDISGGTTTDDASRAVGNEDDETIRLFNDEGAVLCLAASLYEAVRVA